MIIDGTPKDNGWKYCPDCGAKMEGKKATEPTYMTFQQ